MKTAGVILDAWKVPVSRRHLDAAQCTYTEDPGVTPDTRILKVKYEWAHKLKPIVDAAQAECVQIKGAGG